jgi:hypothetical protein
VPELVRVVGSHWAMEECLESAKGEVGLDKHEMCRWDAWYHFIPTLMAHAYLAVLRVEALLTTEKGDDAALLLVTVLKVRRLVRSLVWPLTRPDAMLLHWSRWRRRHQQRAKRRR